MTNIRSELKNNFKNNLQNVCSYRKQLYICINESDNTQKTTIMKIQDLKIGQLLKEGNYTVKVCFIFADRFEVQYISGALWSYRQSDLDNNTLVSLSGKHNY